MKKIVCLSLILIALIISILFVIKNDNFEPPSFDKNAKTFDKIPNEKNVIKVRDDYAFYINGNPVVKDDFIYVDFYSLTSDNIYLKVRILQDDEIIAESGLLKNNEWVEKIKLKKHLSNSKKITYLIMSYEKNTYYSMGEVRLNSTLGEKK